MLEKDGGWLGRLPLDDRRSLRFSNSKVTKIEDNFKKLNDWVKDKLNEDQPIVISSLISDLLQIDNNLSLKSYKALSNLCYRFMENFSYKFSKTSGGFSV